MNVKQILDAVASDSSKNAKIAILTQHKDNEVLKEVIRLAYEPTINFYIKQIEPARKFDGTVTLTGALIRLKNIATRQFTGNAAREYLLGIMQSVTEDDAEVIAKIIARDLRSGFSDSTANKVWKNLIKEFPYQRCSLPKAVDMNSYSWKAGVYSQLKADGMFANVDHTLDGDVSVRSRSGTEFPLTHFAHLVDDVKATFTAGTQSHGELLIKRNGVVLPRQIGNGILNKIAQGGDLLSTDEITYLVWDQIALTSVVPKGKYAVPYSTRFETLQKQTVNSTHIELIPTRIVHNMTEALEHYREMLALGLEGTILKNGTGEWKDGTSKDQAKMKLEIDVDLVIVGFRAGKGKNEELFGSIICQTSDGLLEVAISGFSDELRKEIYDTREGKLGSIVTVKSNGIMPPSKSNSLYSLFLPRFEEFRKDKTEADSLVRVQEQFDNAVK